MNFIDFQKEFFKKLENKTNWGKNDIKNMFNQTYIECNNTTFK